MGSLGYALDPDVRILDTLGLADAFTSHLAPTSAPVKGRTRHWLAGHEKPLPTPWLAARVLREGEPFDAGDLPPPHPSGQLIPATEGEELAEQIAWARAALACPAIQRIQEATSEPLTPGRFLSNLVHAADNTRMRIPADPREAYRRYCGDDTPPEVLAVTGDRSTGP